MATFYFEKKNLKDKEKTEGETLLHILSLTTMPWNCILLCSPGVNLKWSSGSGRREIFHLKKLLGITCLPPQAQIPGQALWIKHHQGS